MLDRRQFLTAAVAASIARPLSLLGTTFPAMPIDRVKQAVIALPEEQADAFRDRLGGYGVLSVRSQDRLDGLLATLAELGWKRPADFPFGAVDFRSSGVLAVVHCGDE